MHWRSPTLEISVAFRMRGRGVSSEQQQIERGKLRDASSIGRVFEHRLILDPRPLLDHEIGGKLGNDLKVDVDTVLTPDFEPSWWFDDFSHLGS